MTGTDRMRLGLMLPIGAGALGDGRPVRWADLREMARTAEAVGVDTLFLPDHLLFRKSPPDNLMQVNMPEGKVRGIWESWTILSALGRGDEPHPPGPARRVHRLPEPGDPREDGGHARRGVGRPRRPRARRRLARAGVPRLRHPLRPPRGALRGSPRDHRARSSARAASTSRASTTRRGTASSHRGALVPGGPPILIGAQRPRMLALAARYADRYDADYHLAASDVGSRFEALDRACAEVKRDPTSIMRTAGTRVALTRPGEPRPGVPGVSAPPGVAAFDLGGMRQMARVGTPDELLAARAHLPGGRRPAPDAEPRPSAGTEGHRDARPGRRGPAPLSGREPPRRRHRGIAAVVRARTRSAARRCRFR